MTGLRVLLILVMVVTLGGCFSVRVPGNPGRGHGPPPHAPAHGHRSHQSGPELRFDAKLGVYVVVGHSDVFFTDGRYLRLVSGAWQVSVDLNGPWRAESERSVPPGLRAAHPGKGKGQGQIGQGKGKKGSPPAKGRW